MQVRDVPSSHGWQWIKQGFALFRRNPLMWIILMAGWFLLFLLVLVIPHGLGALAFALLYPVIYAGAMVGCRALETGEQMEIAHLLAGFRRNTRQLVTVGAITLAVQIAIRMLMSLTGLEEAPLPEGPPARDPAQVMQALLGNTTVRLVEFALSIPLLMAMWFTPALLAFRSMSALDAIRWSFYACVANLGPFLVYGLIAFGLAVLAAIPLGLGFIVLIPTLVATTYTGYRDIFMEEEPGLEAVGTRF